MDNSQNKKSKHRFNALDAVIIILVLAIIAGAVWYFFLRGKQSGTDSGDGVKTVSITYTVQIKMVRDELVDKIKVGDNVTDSVTKYPIGRVVGVTYEPAKQYVNDYMKAEPVEVVYPEHSDVYITIAATATIDDSGWHINNYRMVIGSAVYMRMQNFTGGGYCISITEQ